MYFKLLRSLQITNRVTNRKYTIVLHAREKLLGNVREYNGASKTKTAKVLEASNLRVFYKLDIIDN